MRNVLLFVLAAALAVGPASGAPAAEQGIPALRLDGTPIRPELALTPKQRARGLMFRRTVPEDGMLFVFPGPTRGGFWMKNTFVPLKIVFFDSRGRAVRTLAMTPCRKDTCPVYFPRRQYRFALELHVRDPRPARRLGPAVELVRLTRAAT